MRSSLPATATALLTVTALVIGFGVGALFAGGGGATAPASIASGPGYVPVSYDGRSGVEVSRSAATRDTADAAAGRIASGISDAEFARARAGVEPRDVPRGEGTASVSGRVTTVTGEPLADVVVVATVRDEGDPYGSSSSDFGRGNPIDRSLDETLREQADSWAKARSSRYRSVSGPDGSYRIDGLPTARYYVSGFLDGWVVERTGRSGWLEPGGKQDLLAAPVIELEAQVTLPDGSSPEVAAIRISHGRSTRRVRWTPEDPVLRLSRADGTAVALADFVTGVGYGSDAPARLRSAPVLLDAGAGPLRFELRRQTGIFGRILDEAGGRGTGDVRLLDLSRGTDASAAAFARSAQRAEIDSGVFEFVDLAPGTYAIGLLHGNERLVAKETVVVQGDLVERDLTIPLPDQADAIRTVCLSPRGLPLHDVDFRFQWNDGDRSHSSGVRDAFRDDEGYYWIRLTSLGFSEPGHPTPSTTIEIVGEHSRFGRAVAEITGADREATLQFTEPSRLTVTVAGYETSRHRSSLSLQAVPRRTDPRPEDASVRFMRYNSPSRPETAKILGDGKAVFTQLSPGPWSLQLVLDLPRQSQRTIASVDVQIANADQDAVLPVPALHDVVIQAPSLEPNTHIWFHPKMDADSGPWSMGYGFYLNGRLDERHEWTATDLPAGTYSVQASGAVKPLEVVVPGGPYVLEAPRFDCLRVSISDENGILYKAGLRPGDLVTAIDGVRVEPESWWNLLQKQGTKKNVPLTLLRNGETITLPGGDHAWNGDVGGGYEPASTSEK